MNIDISHQLKEKIGIVKLGILSFSSTVSSNNSELWELITAEMEKVKSNFKIEDVNKQENIASARNAYKKSGKDPNRYRPAADSLLRRIIKGLGLYKVNNVVDVLNYISITSGFSIGGYDLDKIEGNIIFDIGTSSDIYEGIGRGVLNVEGLPILRDTKGPFGCPTSDSLRTMINENTNNIVFIFFDFGLNKDLSNTLSETQLMLEKYTDSKNFNIQNIEL